MEDDNTLFDGCLPRMFAAVAILLLVLLSSCKAKEHIVYENNVVYFRDTIETVRVDSVVITNERLLRDSVFVKDSTMISRDSLGNTLKEVWHYKFLYNWNESRYTALKSEYERLKEKRDSIVYETKYEKVVVQEKQPVIEKIKFASGILVTVLLVWFLFRLIYRLDKNY